MNEAIFFNTLNIAVQSDYRKLGALKNKFGSWENAWAEGRIESKLNPEKEWQKLEKKEIRLILNEDKNYPKLLKETVFPPFGIYVAGELPSEKTPALAVVGTRKATGEGKSLAREFARQLGAAGITIVSGLALGVDAAAHEGCLETNAKTIAVLANGLDSIYPRQNENLAGKILASGGALFSEYPCGAPSLPYRFLERNRIVGGLTRGTLVIEAPEGSGSLVTANFALQENRDVFVIPGPVRHLNFVGSHRLIRSGAVLVTKPEDILEHFGLAEQPFLQQKIFSANPRENAVIAALGKSSNPLSVDKIAELTNLEPRAVNQTLTVAILRGIIKETEEGYMLNF